MTYTYTWTVERREDENSPWLLLDMGTESSSLDIHLFLSRKRDELEAWDFDEPNMDLKVYDWPVEKRRKRDNAA
ncbi:hypothetical protein NONI108955_11085 [Nocardia ninae]|uniref:Uncharacterized protein n=1 Tax=Nocardia ninae NBRC 108245 TaxID=1210091 RepID=A0A511MP95_9NOCA|nr:hypothetical protein [Nocardia ninae]GEM41957.1 hypothetical protein NN4_64760 [Nocardia ninae NBRC 108245]